MRHAALAEGFAVEEDGGHRHDLALSTRPWNSAPSIIVLVTPGLSTAIRLRACTTSGQLWQDSEMKVSNLKVPGRALIWSITAGRPWAGGRRSAAGPAPGGELVAHRDAGEVDARRLARLGDAEGRAQGVLAVVRRATLSGELGDVGEQAVEFLALGAVVQEATSSMGRCRRSR